VTDEFEQRLTTDFIFNGSRQDVIDLWLTNRSNWYPTTLVENDGAGKMRCSVTGVYCNYRNVVPAFCTGLMRHIECDNGQTLHVVKACRRNKVPT